jgi:hypothetical protein
MRAVESRMLPFLGRLDLQLQYVEAMASQFETSRAAMSEPVSEAKFPASTECTGNFIRSAPAARKTAENKSGRPVFYERIPYASEQGIFRRVAGNCIRRSRNFLAGSGKRG